MAIKRKISTTKSY